MSEVAREVTFKCDGCQRLFDSADDICFGPHHWVENAQIRDANLCKRCHVTALGNPPPHDWKQFDDDK